MSYRKLNERSRKVICYFSGFMANELCVRHRTTITDDAIFLIFLNTSCLSQSKLNIAFGHLFYTLKDELSYSLLIQEDLEVLPFRFFFVSFIALYDFTFLCSVPNSPGQVISVHVYGSLSGY